jgi:hypothetical protein
LQSREIKNEVSAIKSRRAIHCRYYVEGFEGG